ncbi:septal ring lytic transglycosylase RlpA family protein [Noviherbaspirillum sp.]|uniref:septal ring lytic transglycosylase RlpA family protein n=1 Tax=Noviherbaspirillum sp. TaxID=1926288 RepID=UPI002B477196|nr:septal ring lytic transglycosylase RlpA family protein [Noviherbaspirillum sp.]HJV83468.1 septal ring lytic transglycosylase RlpA family protein [Noviherbaspirillum sp.]
MGFANKNKLLITLAALSFCSTVASAQQTPSSDAKPVAKQASKKSGIDHSGKARRGKASYYAKKFHGKKMADGTPMNPQSNVAASKTLPLGTKAKVTNLENGKSEVVEIRDRGPYVDGRIVDLSPKTAEKLGIKEAGVAPVEVKPLEVPQTDGSVKLGAAASEKSEPSEH